MQSFLKENKFKHVNAARAHGMLWWKERAGMAGHRGLWKPGGVVMFGL